MLDVSLGTLPRYNLVVDEVVKKPNKQTNLAYMHFVLVINNRKRAYLDYIQLFIS